MRSQLLGLLPLSILISVLLRIWELLADGTSQKVHSTAGRHIPHHLNLCCCHNTVYRSLGYIEVVAAAAEDSMKLAINEIKDMAHYEEKGEVNLNIHVHVLLHT